MTATATWSTHLSSRRTDDDAGGGGLSDLHIAWTLSTPPSRQHLDVSARYSRGDALTTWRVGAIPQSGCADDRRVSHHPAEGSPATALCIGDTVGRRAHESRRPSDVSICRGRRINPGAGSSSHLDN